MKNKKPKTIEEILLTNIEFGAKNKKVWVSKIVPQIKQLIADEVIGEDDTLEMVENSLGQRAILFARERVAENNLREQQRKKLEIL